jgi:hypothetical protein
VFRQKLVAPGQRTIRCAVPALSKGHIRKEPDDASAGRKALTKGPSARDNRRHCHNVWDPADRLQIRKDSDIDAN